VLLYAVADEDDYVWRERREGKIYDLKVTTKFLKKRGMNEGEDVRLYKMIDTAKVK